MFRIYAKVGGDRTSLGDTITLIQSDKWFKQAGIIDNWNVTSTDTASAFRKISRFEFNLTVVVNIMILTKIREFYLSNGIKIIRIFKF